MPQTGPPDERTLRLRRELGERVRSLRRGRKIAQDVLAHSAGMHRSTLQRIEYGQTALSVDKLWAIADRLGVPVTWLVSDNWDSAERHDDPGAGGGEPPKPPATPRHR